MATIKVLEGRNFKSTDPNGLSDPYCLIGAAHPETHEFVDEKICIRTETKRWTLSPVWKKGVIELQKVPRFVRVEVWDKDEEKEDDFVGFALVDLATARGTEDKWIPLLPKPNEKKEALGEVHIIIQMHDATVQAPKNPTPSPAKAPATQPPPASAKPSPAPTSQPPPATSKPSTAPSPAPSVAPANPPPASAKPSPAPTSQPPASSKPSPAPSPAPSNPPPASSKPSPAPSPSPSNPPPASAKPSPVPVPSEKEKKEEAQKRLAEEERIHQEREKKSKEEVQKRAKEEEERKKREQEKRKREDVEKRPKQIADADKHAKLAASYHKQGFVMEALEHYNISAYLYAHLYGSGDKRTIASENAALSLMMGVTFGGAMV